MSQLLSRLEQGVRSANDLDERAEFNARIAAYLARIGEFEGARQKIGALREEYGQGQSGRVTVWIMLAEGLIYLYEKLSPLALDRVTRAQMLALGMRYAPVASLASAWKAHIEFETSKFAAMSQSIEIALANMGESDHDAQTRISIVLSNSFMICGEVKAANEWFRRGRDHALRNGDQASIEALLYNRAAFGLAWLRVEHCDEARTPDALKAARMEIQSARNLQALTGVSALASHIHLWEARSWILEEQFKEAIDRLRSVRTKSPFADYNFSQSFIDLEIAYCHARGGEVEQAISAFSQVDRAPLEHLDADEQIVAAWMLAQLSDISPVFGDSGVHRQRLVDLLRDYRKFRGDLADRLRKFFH